MIDKKTAEAIAVKYYDDVYKFCFSHSGCNENDAADVTQEVFLIFQEKCDELEDKNIKAWLIKTAKHKLHEHFRALKEEDSLIEFEDKSIIFDESEMQQLLDEYTPVNIEEIERCKELVLNGLTKKEQELYIQIFVEKKKHKEIAEELNTSEKAVTVRVHRLRKKIMTLVKVILSSVCQVFIKIFL